MLAYRIGWLTCAFGRIRGGRTEWAIHLDLVDRLGQVLLLDFIWAGVVAGNGHSEALRVREHDSLTTNADDEPV
jgi:hypothetical protein